MEDLRIGVTFQTAEAIQAATDMAGVVRHLKENVDVLGPVVAKAEALINKFSAAENNAAAATAKHAQEQAAAAPAMQRAAEAAAQATRSSEKLSEAERKAAESTTLLAHAEADARLEAERAAGGLDKMAKSGQGLGSDMAKATQGTQAFNNAAEEMEFHLANARHLADVAGKGLSAIGPAGTKAAGGLSDASKAAGGTEVSAMSAGKAFEFLSRSATLFGLGGFGAFEIASVALRKIKKDADEAAAAIIAAGGKNRVFNLQTAELRDNLGLLTDDAGQKRASSIAVEFMRRTGSTVEQASKIMSGMNPAYPVVDPQAPDKDFTSAGFDISLEVGKFMNRTRTPGSVAGEIPKLFSAEGVKSKDDALRVLSKVEAALNSMNIIDAGKAIEQIIKLQAGRPQGSLATTLADLGAAAVGEPSPERAGTKVEMFRNVAAGRPSKMDQAGLLALQAGVLTEAQVRAATPASDKESEFAREEAALDEKDRKGGVGIKRRIEDVARERERIKVDTEALRLKREQTLRDREKSAFLRLSQADQLGRVSQQDTAYRSAQDALRDRTTRLAREEEDLANGPNNTRPQREKLAERRQAEAQKMWAVGLANAYAGMTILEREAFVRKIMTGKTPEQQEALTRMLTEGTEGVAGVRAISSREGMAAAARTSEAVRSARPAVTEQRSEQYIRNSESGRQGVQDARTTADLLKNEGAAFDADLSEWVKSDREQLKRDNIAESTWWPFTMDKSRASLFALDVGQRDAQRKAAAVLKIWQQTVAGLSGRTRRAIGESKLSEYDAYFNRAYNIVVNEGIDRPHSSIRVSTMSQALGVFMRRVSAIATAQGETVPATDIPTGKDMLPNVDRFTGKANASPTVVPPTAQQDRTWSQPDPMGDTPPVPPDAPKASAVPPPSPAMGVQPTTQSATADPTGGQPSASAAPPVPSGPTYNITIGTHVGSLPANYDFPGRGELLDGTPPPFAGPMWGIT